MNKKPFNYEEWSAEFNKKEFRDEVLALGAAIVVILAICGFLMYMPSFC